MTAGSGVSMRPSSTHDGFQPVYTELKIASQARLAARVELGARQGVGGPSQNFAAERASLDDQITM